MRMIKKGFLLIIFCVIACNLYSQKTYPRLFGGNVYDAFTGFGIPDTKLYLLKSDSTIVDSTIVDAGYFTDINKLETIYRLKILETVSKDRDYIIKAVHPQYSTKYYNFSTKKFGRRVQITLPGIYMNRTASIYERALDEVVVSATKVKVYHKGDTLVFNADAFNVPNGSMLDELIKQMPGTELKKNGEIFVNGRKIDYLLLNGQEFFRGRNKLMLENLPYYIVDKIKVYNKTTDRAAALNDETARKDYVMDVNLKKEYRTGYIANMEAGGGIYESYLARLFGLRYSDHARLTLIGNSNNTNLTGLADHAGDFDYELSSDDGITTSHSADMDWLLTGKNYKNYLELEYKNTTNESGQIEHEEIFHGVDRSTYGFTKNFNLQKTQSVNARNKFSLKVPLWFESETAFTYRDSRNNENETGGNGYNDIWYDRNVSFLDSLLELGIPLNTYGLQNINKRQYTRKNETISAEQSFDFAKDLINGDILNLKLALRYDDNDYDAFRREKYVFFQTNSYVQNKNEDITGENLRESVEAQLSYKLKNLWFADWTLFANYKYDYSNQKEQRYNIDSNTFDQENSFDYNTRENVFSTGLSYDFLRFLGKKYRPVNITITLPVIVKHRNSDYTRSLLDTSIVQHHVFFEPVLKSEITINKNKFALASSYSNVIPDVTQLVPMPITSNPVYRYEGNASLKPFSQLSVSLSHKRTLRTHNYWLNNIRYFKSFNQIVNSFTYYPEDGTYLYKPINTNGSWNITYENNYWNYLKYNDKGKWSVKWDGSIRYAENVNYFAIREHACQERNTNKSIRISMPFSFGYFHKDFECMLLGRFAWNHAFNNTSDVAYSNAFDYGVGIDLKKTLFWNITASTIFNINMRSGYSGTNVNRTEYVWDFSASKSFLDERLVLRFKAVDVLRNRTSLTYTVNDYGVSEVRRMRLPGYLLMSVSYRFNKNPKSRK